MRAMILAAGRGSRLRPLTDQTPKPLLPLHGKPLIGHSLEQLATSSVTHIVINLHHLGEQIEEYVSEHPLIRSGRLKVDFSHETELLETGGGIVKALPLLGEQPFWLLNGDIYSNFDFNRLPTQLAAHTAHIAVTPRPEYREQGDFEVAAGRVTQRGNTWVYCGIATLQASLFKPWLETGHFSLRDLYFNLIEAGGLYATEHRGRWHDIGTPAQYRELAGL